MWANNGSDVALHAVYALRVIVEMAIIKLISRSGDSVTLPDVGVTCVVGGNNVGKSQLLRDLHAMISQPNPQTVCLKDFEMRRSECDLEDARA
jgi:ABC-type cobalamin/Fe3+-siderophores transport system ATPase subunit